MRLRDIERLLMMLATISVLVMLASSVDGQVRHRPDFALPPASEVSVDVVGEVTQLGVPIMRRSVVVNVSGFATPQTRELIQGDRGEIIRSLPPATGSGLVVEIVVDQLDEPLWLGVASGDHLNGRVNAVRRLRPAFSLWTFIDAAPNEWRAVSQSDPYRRPWRRWRYQDRR